MLTTPSQRPDGPEILAARLAWLQRSGRLLKPQALRHPEAATTKLVFNRCLAVPATLMDIDKAFMRFRKPRMGGANGNTSH